MEKRKMTCCICGKEIDGWGNNPDGAIDHETLKKISWDCEHVCCNECNVNEVLVGRIALMKAHQIINLLDFKEAEQGLDQLRSLLTEGTISKDEYDFVLANWNLLTK